jgi:hypothetical protein
MTAERLFFGLNLSGYLERSGKGMFTMKDMKNHEEGPTDRTRAFMRCDMIFVV